MTHRSAISLPLFHFIWGCFQSGMGSKQVSDVICCQHLRRYDELQIQYYDAIRLQKNGIGRFCDLRYIAFSTFNDQSDSGYYGFSPSSQWLRDVYDSFIEEHEPELNQHTSMLPAMICRIDHSFKVSCIYIQSFRTLIYSF